MRRFIFTFICFWFAFNLFAQDYFPLKVGNTWILDELNTNGNIIGSDTTIIKDNFIINKLNIFLMTEKVTDSSGTNITDTELYTDSINHNDIYFKVGNESHKIFQHNYKNGDKWSFMSDTTRVEYIGSINVPAGNFNNCFYVKTNSTSGWIFAPNIGIIKTIVDDKTKLALKHFNVIITDIPIAFNDLNTKITVYPNPTTDHISISNIENVTKLEIYDITGKLYYEAKSFSNNYETIKTSNFPIGMYSIRILTNKNEYLSAKFIKK